MRYSIRNPKTRKEGKKRIEWARAHMPVLEAIGKKFEKKKPLAGRTVGMCLHVEPKTAVLAITLKRAGAKVAITGCNPLSTQDSAAASLALDYGIDTFTWYNETAREYYQNINRVLSYKPEIVIDDGCDLIFTLHKKQRKLLPNVIGGAEETTTGIHRIASMVRDAKLKFPVMDVNNAMTKHLFDNRYGTGQSTLEGIMTATNLLIAGKTFVVGGYGWCGRGLAHRARGLGANVIITETDAVRAIEAKMEGFQVMPMSQAAGKGDIFVTATGNANILNRTHFKKMKDGAVIANTGHFNVEINIPQLKKMAKRVRNVRKNVDEYLLSSGRRIYLLAKGRLVNLAAAQGHAIEVMDMSFANQALAVEYLSNNEGKLPPALYPIPEKIDRQIAKLWLSSKGVRLDTLTRKQKKYMTSWDFGT